MHVDGTGSGLLSGVTVCSLLHRLLAEWTRRTGVPILLNTSFNLAGEPIVETPEDALHCLLSSGIGCCVLGDWIAEARPDTTLLDLHPVRIASPAGANGTGSCLVDTPWGSRTVALTVDEAAVVADADGCVAAAELAGRHLPCHGPRQAIQLLHRLWRLRVVDFREPSAADSAADPQATWSNAA